jgi:hypothetical protein
VVSHTSWRRFVIHSNLAVPIRTAFEAPRYKRQSMVGASEARHASMHRLSLKYTRTASAERDARHPGGVESSVTRYVYIGPDTAIGRGG